MSKKEEQAKPEVNKNLDIWHRVAVTDERFTKQIQGKGYKGTDINPTYRAMRMTEVFGPFGKGWGFESVEFCHIPINENDIGLICNASIWYMDGDKKCIAGPCSGGNMMISKGRFDEDAYKKAQTDAMTQCFRWLGISADIYMGVWDDEAYREASQADIGDSMFGISLVREEDERALPPDPKRMQALWEKLRLALDKSGKYETPTELRQECQRLVGSWVGKTQGDVEKAWAIYDGLLDAVGVDGE